MASHLHEIPVAPTTSEKEFLWAVFDTIEPWEIPRLVKLNCSHFEGQPIACLIAHGGEFCFHGPGDVTQEEYIRANYIEMPYPHYDINAQYEVHLEIRDNDPVTLLRMVFPRNVTREQFGKKIAHQLNPSEQRALVSMHCIQIGVLRESDRVMVGLIGADTIPIGGRGIPTTWS